MVNKQKSCDSILMSSNIEILYMMIISCAIGICTQKLLRKFGCFRELSVFGSTMISIVIAIPQFVLNARSTFDELPEDCWLNKDNALISR